MAQVLTLRVHIKSLGRKIWREIEISDRATIADLAYTILASFRSEVTHLYQITYKDIIYDCGVAKEEGLMNVPGFTVVDAFTVQLSTLHLVGGEVLKMEYDFGSTTEFCIKVLGSELMRRGTGIHYPYVIDGAGWGMVENVCGFELKEAIDEADRNGSSELVFSNFFDSDRWQKIDYRDYDVEMDNMFLKDEVAQIRLAYEEEDY